MKSIAIYLIVAFSPLAAFANEATVVEENVVSKWGYFTKSLPNSYNYNEINQPGQTTSVRYQLIRSKLPIHGYSDSYYYFGLSEECFSNKYRALRRRIALAFRDEKDYRLSFLNGNCVYITACSANMDRHEQPKIHKLFEEYILEKRRHNTSFVRTRFTLHSPYNPT